jgi:hypothetical protein
MAIINDAERAKKIARSGLEELESAFVGADFEWCVQRAEGNGGGEQEYGSQNQQHNAGCAGNNTAEIQVSEHGGDNDTDNAVNIRHIAFHRNSP